MRPRKKDEELAQAFLDLPADQEMIGQHAHGAPDQLDGRRRELRLRVGEEIDEAF